VISLANIVVTPIHTERRKKKRTSSATDSTVESVGLVDSNIEIEEQQHSSEPIMLNYLTAPTVLLWSAACASCAVPGLYAPVELLAKNPQGDIIPYLREESENETITFGAGCTDGSVTKMDVAIDRLRTLFK
jgi:TAG lipase/steryl ester hydrolase/phospholipase A2/LPA acyltransferase